MNAIIPLGVQKNLFSCLIAIAFFQICFSQTPTHHDEYLSQAGLNKLIFKKFSAITTGGGTTNTMVSYASLDPLNGKASFNCTAPLNKNSTNDPRIFLLSLKLSGDLLSDNSIVLFKDAKINTGAAFNTQFHWGPTKPDGLVYLESYSVRLNQQRRSLDYKRAIDSMNMIVDKQKSEKMISMLEEFKTKKADNINDLNSKISTLEGLKDVKYSDSILKCFSKIKSLEVEILKISLQQDSIKHSIDDRSYINGDLRKTILDEKYAQKRTDLEADPAFDKVHFWWITTNVGFSRKEYHSFDRTAIFQNQVVTKDLYTYNIGLSYNYFSEGSSKVVGVKPDNRRSYYFNCGISYLKDNNTGLLKTTEISEERVFKNVAGDTVRKILEKYNAYTDSIVTSDVISVSANFYWTQPSGSISFHIFPSVDSYIEGATILNLGVGVLASFKNSKKDQPAINTELYVQVLDLCNQLDRSKILSLGQIGIRFSHSFNFFR